MDFSPVLISCFRYDGVEKFNTDEHKLESFLFFTLQQVFIELKAIKGCQLSKLYAAKNYNRVVLLSIGVTLSFSDLDVLGLSTFTVVVAVVLLSLRAGRRSILVIGKSGISFTVI